MKKVLGILTALSLLGQATAQTQAWVDYDAYEQLVREVKPHRAARLLSLNDFLKKAQEPGTIILDTRSQAMYALKHIKGALHLDFSDFTQHTLDSLLAPYGGRNAQILIYCNNNFTDRKTRLLMDAAFPTKAAQPPVIPAQKEKPGKALPAAGTRTLALNIPTYLNLYGYGYRNVYELSELVEVHDPRIAFEGSFR